MPRTRSTLVVIRGNSASGKTTAAREVRARYGRGAALIEQDYLRRVLLREHDIGGIDAAAPAVITATARAALEHGYHAIVEGMLIASRYATALRELIAGHRGPSHVFYLDVSLPETLRRHRGKDGLAGVTDEDLRSWYTERDLLGVPTETVIDESSTFEDTVTTILRESGLATAPQLAACPTRCPRCQEKTRTPPGRR
ncbi:MULTISPECIES: AAA family ATPase [Catenuloplanes]|uniref:AAA family ATPase n=1 Tax=Catenuloplanes TaxID=33874 RepID=UPI0035B50787